RTTICAVTAMQRARKRLRRLYTGIQGERASAGRAVIPDGTGRASRSSRYAHLGAEVQYSKVEGPGPAGREQFLCQPPEAGAARRIRRQRRGQPVEPVEEPGDI